MVSNAQAISEYQRVTCNKIGNSAGIAEVGPPDIMVMSGDAHVGGPSHLSKWSVGVGKLTKSYGSPQMS